MYVSSFKFAIQCNGRMHTSVKTGVEKKCAFSNYLWIHVPHSQKSRNVCNWVVFTWKCMWCLSSHSRRLQEKKLALWCVCEIGFFLSSENTTSSSPQSCPNCTSFSSFYSRDDVYTQFFCDRIRRILTLYGKARVCNAKKDLRCPFWRHAAANPFKCLSDLLSNKLRHVSRGSNTK